jgi:TonB family protein
MGRNFLVLALCLATAVVCAPAAAPTAHTMKQQVEARMLVTGSIDIEPDGHVSAVSLDELEKIPDAVVDLVERAAAKWRFEPIVVEGVPVPARASMSLKVIANKVPDSRDEFRVRLDGARFGDERKADAGIDSVEMKPPTYPKGALYDGVSGTAYVALRLGSDGRVEDLVVEQVNLEQVADKRRMDNWRKDFANAALEAARKWQFSLRPDMPDDPASRTVRVSVDYKVVNAPKRRDAWSVYVPGPRSEIPWLEGEDQSTVPPDALAADTVHPASNGRRLLSALDPGS